MNGEEVQPQSSLDALVDAFSSGFQGSKELTALFLIIVSLIIAILVVVAVLQSRRTRRRLRAVSAETFDIVARKHQLSRTQRDLAEQIADCCKPAERKHLVLVNHHIFNECVGIARELGTVPEVALSALRLKLGFIEIGPEQVPQSTEEIPKGSAILLNPGRGRTIKVRVNSQTEKGISVSSSARALRFSLGTLLVAHFANRSGLYTFDTHVKEIERDSLILDHSDDIRRTQRRRFFRKKTNLRVEIFDIDFMTKFDDAVIVDLSGAGAAITDPELFLHSGMEIGLTFTLASEQYNIPGRVLFISKHSRTAHIIFEKLAPTVQDRIIRQLLKPIDSI